MRSKPMTTARWLLPVAGVIWLAGCATTPEEDPVLQGKLGDLDTRTTNIERVVQNQSLLSLSQRAVAAAIRRFDSAARFLVSIHQLRQSSKENSLACLN